ncbi:hypothetical protein MMC07_007937 [Pseudocyphellaria aurata]|nr:hypothetical protein [Pseudocyphellaria aurata]
MLFSLRHLRPQSVHPLPSLLQLTTTSPHHLRRSYATSSSASDRTSDRVPTNDPEPPPVKPNVSESNAAESGVSALGMRDAPFREEVADAERQRQLQAPNRAEVWSRSQQPRAKAMVGPRFEQTIMEYQPQPQAAISLIHKQPVRWTSQRVVSCDGGGGPLGHPRIFINVDKPQINWCTYCGLPFAHEHHRKHLQSLPRTSYPLEPVGDDAEVGELQQVTDEAFAQR